jgi:hypothetical protein
VLLLLAIPLLAAHSGLGFAHGDEDHGEDAKPAANINAMPATGTSLPADKSSPTRLPDGSVWVPKPAQHLLGIRTILGKPQDIAATVAINGRVVADPNFSGRVQSGQAGRIEAAATGFPYLGLKVSKGQVLAFVTPVASSIERANQRAQLAELDSNRVIAEKRVKRLEQLVGGVPRKDIIAARAELEGLSTRRAAIASGLSQREELRAPTSGVISLANVVAGQIVDARDVLFEIIDPQKLWVEAIAYDTALASESASASAMTSDSQTLVLSFLGPGYQLREQALPLLFSIHPPVPALSVGQPVKVLVQTRRAVRGIAVPQASLLKNATGESMVWVHASAERFTPKKVRAQPLDGSTAAVLQGLEPGDRVVTEGAALLSQVR